LLSVPQQTMINITKDQVLTVQQAATRLPSRRGGRPTHPSTVTRWMKEGIGGVRLEGIRIGASICTSVEALQRFFYELTRLQVSATRTGQEVTK
jgi:hypothetical protein